MVTKGTAYRTSNSKNIELFNLPFGAYYISEWNRQRNQDLFWYYSQDWMPTNDYWVGWLYAVGTLVLEFSDMTYRHPDSESVIRELRDEISKLKVEVAKQRKRKEHSKKWKDWWQSEAFAIIISLVLIGSMAGLLVKLFLAESNNSHVEPEDIIAWDKKHAFVFECDTDGSCVHLAATNYCPKGFERMESNP